jgi:hypothetical protein
MDLTRLTTVLVPATVACFPGGQVGDLVALADFKLELNIRNSGDDAWLKKLITRLSAAATNYCNRRTFALQLWQDQVWPAKDAYPWQLPPRIGPWQLSQWPLAVTPSPAGTAPPLAPALAPVGGGALPATRYYARVSYVTPMGETALSQESNLLLAPNTLPEILAPGADNYQLATGWNVYLGTTSFGETRQNATPIGVDSSFTLPSSGLIAGPAPPAYITVVENAPLAPTPLAEGVDFLVDAELGQLTRLYQIDLQPKNWNLPAVAIYPAPFATPPLDLQDALILMAKGRFFGRERDPMIRSENAASAYEAQYFFATGPGGQGDLPIDAMAKLDRYRVPVVA